MVKPTTRAKLASFLSLGLFMILVPAAAAFGDSGEDLRAAAALGDEAKVRALLEAGVPVDAEARHGRTALLEAANKGQLAVARLLIERGANVNVREDFFGVSAVTAALQTGNVELVGLLLEKGAEGAFEVLFAAIQRDDVGLARMAFATGKVEPLELAAARRESAQSSPELREFLAQAEAVKRQFEPYEPKPERLEESVGKYERPDGGLVARIIRQGKSVEVKIDGEEGAILAAPVEADRFDSADGKVSMFLGGRGGLIEFLLFNREGDISFLRKAQPTEPTDLRAAEGKLAEEEAPARSAAAIVPRPWPQFRGEGAKGVADGQGAPKSWDVSKGVGVRFKTEIPGLALSSPVVWGNRIYVTTAVAIAGETEFNNDKYNDMTPVNDQSEQSFRLYALDTAKGEIVWQREVFRGKPGAPRHIKSSQANSTPLTDGERVVVLFGSIGKLVTYDQAGKLLWQVDLGVLDSTDPPSGTAGWGHASSPILVGEKVIVQADLHKSGFLAAFDIKDGKELWRTQRQDLSSWATPTLVKAKSGDELVVNATTIRGYDPNNGKELWHLGPSSEVVVSTPQEGNGLIYVTAGYPPVRPVYAIRPGQRGDLSLPAGASSSAAIAWSHGRGGTYIPTPILYRGFYHTCNNNGIFTTYDAASGKILATQRLSGSGIGVSASPIAADGRIFVFGEDGTAYVLASGPEPELLGTYSVGEAVMATPAISGGLMVVRTLGHVIGLESTAAPSP